MTLTATATHGRERLQALMLFRVILVTMFLGAALLLDVNALADFSDRRNTTILTLIIGTYALTIVYALLLRAGSNIRELAAVQLTIDIVTVGVLVDTTGGVDSPFLFLFSLFVAASALVLGRRAALYTALAVTVMMLALAADPLGLFADVPAPGAVWKEMLFRIALNGSASLIIALLAGYLTEMLGQAATRIEEQQASLDRLRALNDNILSSLTSGLMTVDASEQIIFFNLAAEQILGAPASDVLQRPLTAVFPALTAITANDSRQRGELRYEREGGETVYLGYSVSPLVVEDEQQNGRIIIFQDLSEIKRLEGEVQRSERLAAIGALAAGIAHEIRNPLAAISGSVEMLSDEDLSADDQHLLRIVLREVDRLNGLITDFLEYSRPRPLTLIATSLHREVVRATELFTQRADIELETEFGEDIEVLLDPEAFQQVLWNLLNNAAQAAATAAAPRVRLRVEANTLWVEDNGPGITAEPVDKIFEPFFTTRAEGTGLGLATIYTLLQSHDAQIIAHRHGALGGASFEVRLAQPEH